MLSARMITFWATHATNLNQLMLTNKVSLMKNTKVKRCHVQYSLLTPKKIITYWGDLRKIRKSVLQWESQGSCQQAAPR